MTNEECVVNIPNILWDITIREAPASSKGCIFRIPGLLKMKNEQAYTPYRFSFGPWHFGKTQLVKTAQAFKEAFFEGLIYRFPDPAAKMRELEEAIKEIHVQARECYEGDYIYEDDDSSTDEEDEEDIEKAKEEFQKILLLDGCFIIELFRKYAGEVPKQEGEHVLFSKGMLLVIYHDLFLLENQIPWCVLELLFAKTRRPKSGSTNLIELAIRFFSPAFSQDEPQMPSELLSSGSNVVHLVHLASRYLGFSTEKGIEIQQMQSRNTFPSATRLKEAGVRFRKAEARNILDVRFNKKEGVLEIPSLLIHPSTETIFRNLISFEQCTSFCKTRVTCYAMLLDCLVDSSEDVDLMSREGVFSNWLNQDVAARFLNRIRNGTCVDVFFYAELCDDVNRHCRRWWPRWRAALIHNYFTKPWAVVSVIFAIIVLLFTIMQVFYK